MTKNDIKIVVVNIEKLATKINYLVHLIVVGDDDLFYKSNSF